MKFATKTGEDQNPLARRGSEEAGMFPQKGVLQNSGEQTRDTAAAADAATPETAAMHSVLATTATLGAPATATAAARQLEATKSRLNKLERTVLAYLSWPRDAPLRYPSGRVLEHNDQ